ncbi:hypothetical protein EMCRGX_G031465 [Ephydatia muelleri]
MSTCQGVILEMVLTLSDYFSKWVEAIPIPKKEACEVSKALYKIFMRMGLPEILTTDNGTEFKNQLNVEMGKRLNIKQNFITHIILSSVEVELRSSAATKQSADLGNPNISITLTEFISSPVTIAAITITFKEITITFTAITTSIQSVQQSSPSQKSPLQQHLPSQTSSHHSAQQSSPPSQKSPLQQSHSQRNYFVSKHHTSHHHRNHHTSHHHRNHHTSHHQSNHHTSIITAIITPVIITAIITPVIITAIITPVIITAILQNPQQSHFKESQYSSITDNHSQFNVAYCEDLGTYNEEENFDCILPTGYGKSLCYACLPIVFEHLLGIPQGDPQSIVIVVIPLTAIIEDQVRSFTARGLAVAGVTSSTVQALIY